MISSQSRFTKIIIPPSRESKFHGNCNIVPWLPSNYLGQFQETVNDNYTNVYPTEIYQLVDMFLCEKNVSEEERRNLPSARRWLSSFLVCCACRYEKNIYLQSTSQIQLHTKKSFIRPSCLSSTSTFAEDGIMGKKLRWYCSRASTWNVIHPLFIIHPWI